MWILNTLKKQIIIGDKVIDAEDDIYAGYLVVYKSEEEAQKGADKLNCGITEISLEPNQDNKQEEGQ